MEGHIAARTFASPHLPSVYNTPATVPPFCLRFATGVSTRTIALDGDVGIITSPIFRWEN